MSDPTVISIPDGGGTIVNAPGSGPASVVSVPVAPTTVVNARSGEEVVVITAIRGERGDSGGGAPAIFPFTDASLSLVGILSLGHSLGRVPVAIRVLDPAGNTVFPDNEVTANTTAISVDLATFRPLLAGTWQLIIY